MGRPINKRHFGASTTDDNNIRVRFHNGTSSVDGYIVKQLGSKKFLCSTYSATPVRAVCKLTNDIDANLTVGQMTIKAKGDDGTTAGAVGYVSKITAKKMTVVNASGTVIFVGPWNFSTSTTDRAAQLEEAGNSTVTGTNVTDL
jgi:hypothetical protein